MAGIETEILGGIVAAAFGGIGWMFKGVAKKANDASALSKELKHRVGELEAEAKVVRETNQKVASLEADMAHVKNDMKDVKSGVNQIVKHLITTKD